MPTEKYEAGEVHHGSYLSNNSVWVIVRFQVMVFLTTILVLYLCLIWLIYEC